MALFRYEFEWDPVKARTNFTKHGFDFVRAATVFLDPLALTIPDGNTALPRSGGLRWEETLRDHMCSLSTRLHNWRMIGDEFD